VGPSGRRSSHRILRSHSTAPHVGDRESVLQLTLLGVPASPCRRFGGHRYGCPSFYHPQPVEPRTDVTSTTPDRRLPLRFATPSMVAFGLLVLSAALSLATVGNSILKGQLDFSTLYSAGLAQRLGLNPYDVHTLCALAHARPCLPYNYLPRSPWCSSRGRFCRIAWLRSSGAHSCWLAACW
jgi:hypothetical protein